MPAAVCLCVLCTVIARARAAGMGLLNREKEKQLDVLVDGKLAVRYMYAYDNSSPERLAETYKPYLHVFDADGKSPITNGPGGEYTHHRGIFIGWNKIKVGDKTYDRWHMKGGEIVHQKFGKREAGGERAEFTSVTHWNDETGKPFLDEQRMTTVLPADPPARLVIGITFFLTATDSDVILDGDPEHAGVHFRPSDAVDRAKTVYLYPRANAKPHDELDYPWVAEQFTLGDTGKTYAVIEFNHPDNPKGTRWSAYRNYGRFGAFAKATVKKGETLVLKYSFLIADGDLPPADAIQKAFDHYVTAKPSPAPETTRRPAEQPAPKAPAKPQAAVPAAPVKVAAATAPTSAPAPKKRAKTSRTGPADAPLKFDLPAPKPLSVEEALKTFALPEGLRIERVAAEPMVEEPIAISFDHKGRMYVVEMRGYMLDVEANGEEDPTGRIKRLDDTDGDGRMDKATVFLDGLVMPRAVMAYRNGAIVGVPPELAYWEDTNDDGVADKKTVIATDYGTKGGQPEHMANTPTYALDNWIYSSAYPAKVREVRGQWTSAPTEKRGQYGLSQDDLGRFYFSTNSDVGRADPLQADYFFRNPDYKARAGQNIGLMKSQATWPSHPTPGVNRGYENDQLRADGTLATATAAGGSAVYRGGLFPPEYAGNLFTPEPSGNLVKRILIKDTGGKLTGENAYDGKEFLTSTDERFRPVSACVGPDGALYVVDMYKGVLQHYYFLTHYLIKNIKQRGLEEPIHWGRIYRIVPEGTPATPTKITAEVPALVDALNHPNGWVRDTAQRMLVERNDKNAVVPLKKLAAGGATPVARLHALWTLQGMGRLDDVTTRKALADGDADVRASVVRLCEPLLVPATRAQILPALLKLANDKAPQVQLQLALSLGGIPEPGVEEMITRFLAGCEADPDVMRDCVISGLRGRELEFIERLASQPQWSSESPARATTLTELARCVMQERRGARVGRLLELAAGEPEASWRQMALLTGMAPKLDVNTGKPAPGGKLIYLPAAPDELRGLLNADSLVRDLAQLIDTRLAWPDKPGVPPPPKIVPLTPEQQARFDHGKSVYAQTCAACHQPTGVGQEGLAPPLVDSEWALGPPQRVVRIALQGVKGPISVDGANYNMEMPGLSAMSDAELAAVLTYVRREWENNADPIDEQTVAAVREKTKNRADLWTAKELVQIK
jgi:mono/diheme cytochrome c family protein/glucose/arabinose dehydrogenase